MNKSNLNLVRNTKPYCVTQRVILLPIQEPSCRIGLVEAAFASVGEPVVDSGHLWPRKGLAWVHGRFVSGVGCASCSLFEGLRGHWEV